MAKKKEAEATPEVQQGAAPLLVAPLELDFGRADLNLLRDKLNEVIAHLNER